ncbi:hypothetical protein U9M48_012218 [Paspalum notatum var. saurae]|uniref:Uncharacterized protein n=1 Tax=Paspalum notatum var. saurae TaxID=547442 RepID=A0AAQ3SZH0_PASNO
MGVYCIFQYGTLLEAMSTLIKGTGSAVLHFTLLRLESFSIVDSCKMLLCSAREVYSDCSYCMSRNELIEMMNDGSFVIKVDSIIACGMPRLVVLAKIFDSNGPA